MRIYLPLFTIARLPGSNVCRQSLKAMRSNRYVSLQATKANTSKSAFDYQERIKDNVTF